MSQEITTVKKELPALSELYDVSNIETVFKTDQFNLLVNQAPDPKWIQENKFAGNSKYIPIGILETLLQRIFKQHKVEVLREGTMFNSVYVAIRLHYLHPVTNLWEFHDGLGAMQVQTKAGASPADLSSINNNAVMMALPMAKSYAIKDACDHFGKLFGRDLNRKETMGFGVDKNLDSELIFNELKSLFNDKKDKIPSSDFKEIEKSAESEFNFKKIKEYKRFIELLKSF